MQGKEEFEDCSALVGALETADGHCAVVALNNFTADPEAEAGPFGALGGEEGFIDVLQ